MVVGVIAGQAAKLVGRQVAQKLAQRGVSKAGQKLAKRGISKGTQMATNRAMRYRKSKTDHGDQTPDAAQQDKQMEGQPSQKDSGGGGGGGGGGKYLRRAVLAAGTAAGGPMGLMTARKVTKKMKITRSLMGPMHQIPYKLAAATKSHR